MKKQNKTESIHVRVTETEKKALLAEAQKHNLTLSQYIYLIIANAKLELKAKIK